MRKMKLDVHGMTPIGLVAHTMRCATAEEAAEIFVRAHPEGRVIAIFRHQGERSGFILGGRGALNDANLRRLANQKKAPRRTRG
jgi:hypothetical protein